MAVPPIASELSALPCADFVAAIGSVYEKSPWIAERAHAAGPFDSLDKLRAALKVVVDTATQEEQLALLRAHPDLAGKAALAGELTCESTEEQARAGLGSLTADEMARFVALNGTYKERFSFPFILAVRNANKATIFQSFERRVHNTASAELAECLTQVHKIAWMRLRMLVTPNPTGFLTCHVLDTARGCPAAGMAISLRRLDDATGGYVLLSSHVTNSDGRLDGGPALKGTAFKEGKYEWTFVSWHTSVERGSFTHTLSTLTRKPRSAQGPSSTLASPQGVGDYFAAAGVPTAGTPFLGEVPLRFGIDDPEAHYHVPLLCSPWSYSTYRGS